jgi:hypothetical protein
MKKIVFTVIFGDYDTLRDPPVVSPHWQYICLTDQDLHSKTWKIIRVAPNGPDRLFARYVWTHYHEYFESDAVLKIDAGMVSRTNLAVFDDALQTDHDILLCKHRVRDCLYEEAGFVTSKFPDQTEIVAKQMQRYQRDGFPRHFGLHANTYRLMKTNDRVQRFNALWWDEISRGCFRDQLSFDYVRWKHPGLVSVGRFDFHVFENGYFFFLRHKAPR